MFTLPTMPFMGKGVNVACLVNKSKPTCVDSRLWMTWPLKLSDNDGYIVLMDPTISDVNDDNWLRTIIRFCIVLITDEIVWLCEQHLVPYEYAGISLVVIEASKWLL